MYLAWGPCLVSVAYVCLDREEATKESDFTYDEETEEADEDNDWSGEVESNDQDEVEGGGDGDVADESTAYLEFLNQEVRFAIPVRSRLVLLINPRPKNLDPSPRKKTMNWMKRACWKPR